MTGQEWTWEGVCRSLGVEMRHDAPMTATFASLFGALATKAAQQEREIEVLTAKVADLERTREES